MKKYLVKEIERENVCECLKNSPSIINYSVMNSFVRT